MADKPILFSAPMIQALLAGRKTQTRRILKPQPEPEFISATFETDRFTCCPAMLFGGPTHKMLQRIHRPGTRLWVRETWRSNYGLDCWDESLGRVRTPKDFDPKTSAIEYMADGERELGGRVYPGIHMPRWASRLTLTVKDVRVQRLQDISEADAKAEGLDFRMDWLPQWRGGPDLKWHSEFPIDAFQALWEHINGPGSWDINPWIVAYTFDVHKCNIDKMEAE